jgi:hypothetical protein
MNDENRAITLSTSRMKLVPQAIVLTAFIIPFGLLSVGSGYALAGKDYVKLDDIAIFALPTAILMFFAWLQVRTLRRIASPDLLGVTVNGLELTTRGTRQYHPWATLGEPEMRRLSGKSASRSLIFPRRASGRLVIPIEEYRHLAEDILLVLKQAKAGSLIELPQEPSNSLYMFLAVPAACLTLSIVLVGLALMFLR